MKNAKTLTSDNRQPSIERFYTLGSRDYDEVIEYMHQNEIKKRGHKK